MATMDEYEITLYEQEREVLSSLIEDALGRSRPRSQKIRLERALEKIKNAKAKPRNGD